MQEYQVGVEFRPGEGTWYEWPSNMMVIDSNKNSVKAAFSFIHEMTHASRYNQGMNRTTLPRQEYIEKRLEEEAEAAVRKVEAKMQLWSIGIPVLVKAAFFEDQYMTEYEASVTMAKAQGSLLTKAEQKALAREAGKNAMIEGYWNGLIVTSRNQETYPSKYGKLWDRMNQVAQYGKVN